MATTQANDDRAIDMADQYVTGSTLKEIGEYFSLTRERVRQILKANFGISKQHGGASLRHRRKMEAKELIRNNTYISQYGVALAEYIEINTNLDTAGRRPIRRFTEQKRNAIKRNVPWLMTFSEWWNVWSNSGRWPDRGRKRGGYVMARYGDLGSYEVGNVKIIEGTENQREYISRYWREVKSGQRERPKNSRTKQTHCKRNHPFDDKNTYISPMGQRSCLTCRKSLAKKRYLQRKLLATTREPT